MALRLKLGAYETVTSDPLGRTFSGYFPRMTETEAWEVGRGVWRMNTVKAARQRFAVIVGEGLVRAVGEIAGVSEHGDRVALEGAVLAEGHPVRDAWIGQPDPVVNGSQNPVGYCELPEEKEFVFRACACGCEELTDRDFLPGHDVRAIQARVRQHFAGSPLKLIHWIDTTLATPDPQNSTTRLVPTGDNQDAYVSYDTGLVTISVGQQRLQVDGTLWEHIGTAADELRMQSYQ